MPKIVYHVAMSLDGYIADKESGVDWLNTFNGFDDAEFAADFMVFQNSFDAIVLGGHTYDFALNYGQWMSPGTPTWVFTSRKLKLLDPSIQLTDKSPKDVYQELDARNINRVWLMGGGKLAASFLEQDLVHKIQLSIIPIILGQGVSLFADPASHYALRLTEFKTYGNGIVNVQYDVSS